MTSVSVSASELHRAASSSYNRFVEAAGFSKIAMQTVKQPAEILGEKRIIQTHLVSGLLYQLFCRHDTGSGKHVTNRISRRQVGQQNVTKLIPISTRSQSERFGEESVSYSKQ